MGIATGISFQTTAGRAAFLDGPNLISGPFRCINGDVNTVVAIYNNTGGTVSVKIYASPTS